MLAFVPARLGCWLFVVAGLVILSAARAEERVTIYVSPYRVENPDGTRQRPWPSPADALHQARQIAAIRPRALLEIVLLPGTHRITQPVSITFWEVPPQGKLVLRAEQEHQAILSGGVVLRGWQVDRQGRWIVRLPESVLEAGGPRELFVNGQAARWARHPNRGFLRVVRAFDDKRSGFFFPPGSLPAAFPGGGELVFLHDWSISRVPIARVNHAKGQLQVAAPIGPASRHYRIDHFEPHPRFFVQGHLALLDRAGEWAVDEQGRLVFWPPEGLRPEETEVVVPVAPALVTIHGTPQRPIRNVTVQGLVLEHCAWHPPRGGYAAGQATWHERRETSSSAARVAVPAAVDVALAQRCHIERCWIRNLGTSGVWLGFRTRECRVTDCVIENTSGNGVNVGEDRSRRVGQRPWWQVAPEQAAADHLVAYNRIQRCGRQFYGAVGVWVGLARGIRVEHNEIAHLPYTGVSVGWMWNPTPTPAGNNRIARNHIHHVMQVLSDGGGIYTLGRQPGTRITGNVIHHIPRNAGRAESNGMFLDEGSDQIEVDHNTIYAVERSPLRFHRAQHLWVHDNLLVVPEKGVPPYRYNATDPQRVRRKNDRVVLQQQFDPRSVELPVTGPRGGASPPAASSP